MNSGASYLTDSLYCRALPLEVIDPPVLPWMEEPGHAACDRVKRGDVWTFVQIAMMASQGKVADIVGSLVLPWDDMLHMKLERLARLLDAAIFATVIRSAADELANPRVH